MGFTRVIEITAAQGNMPSSWAHRHIGLLGIREEPGAVAVPQVGQQELADNDQLFKAYIKQQLAPAHDMIFEQRKRLESIEATLNERTGRLLALESTLEERSNRLAALEKSASLRHRRLRSLFGRNR